MSVYLDALKADLQGNWDEAHNLIQHDTSSDAAWIHAYLHRKEGDDGNASYWYRRAEKPFFNGSLQDEFNSLWDYFE